MKIEVEKVAMTSYEKEDFDWIISETNNFYDAHNFAVDISDIWHELLHPHYGLIKDVKHRNKEVSVDFERFVKAYLFPELIEVVE